MGSIGHGEGGDQDRVHKKRDDGDIGEIIHWN